jgi:hypothetical protein
MKNEIICLRNDEQRPRKQYKNLGVSTYGSGNGHEINHNIKDIFPRPRPPKIQNINDVVMEEDFDEFPKGNDHSMDFQEVNNQEATRFFDSKEMDSDTLKFHKDIGQKMRNISIMRKIVWFRIGLN